MQNQKVDIIQSNNTQIYEIIKNAYKFGKKWSRLFFVSIIIFVATIILYINFINDDKDLWISYVVGFAIFIITWLIMFLYRYIKMYIVLFDLRKKQNEIRTLFNVNVKINDLIMASYFLPIFFFFMLISEINKIYKKSLDEAHNDVLFIDNKNKNITIKQETKKDTKNKLSNLDKIITELDGICEQ